MSNETTGTEHEALQLYYVRHGETEWSLSGQHTGVTDIPLTEHGERQASALAPWLLAPRFEHVYSSPRCRAVRTCELSGMAARVETDPELAEWSYGDYEGRRTVDIRLERPDWNIWTDGCPGGESPDEVSRRADRVLGRMTQLSGNVAVFGHGQFGSVLAARWNGLPVRHARIFTLSPASLGILGHDARSPEVPVVALWNATPALLNVGN